MAVVQTTKNAVSAAMFPNKVATEHQSLVLVKRLLAVAISCITYLRGIFPEHAYGTRYLEDLCVKILREDDSCPGSSQIVKWMMGCYDALQKKYLRMLILAIYTNQDVDCQTVTECYQFKFKYMKDGPSMDFTSNNGKVRSTVHCSDTKRTSILLIRKLYVLMQSLGPLPNDICLKMKLTYYDEVTPPEYQPPGFREGTSESMIFEGDPVFLRVGEVATPFHVLKLKVTTDSERMAQTDRSLEHETGGDGGNPPGQRAGMDQNEQVEINDTLPAESPAASQTLAPENANDDEQDEETRIPPKAGKNANPKSISALTQVENLVNKTSEMGLTGRRTRSGRRFDGSFESVEPLDNEQEGNSKKKVVGKRPTGGEQSKPVYQFEIPCSQDEVTVRKRKKFSEPKERFR
ncbi:HORMA domain-containing protein 1 [Leucoraja erinacea]|uniref:HORMA domain-containing protein 1 n=1 Tax=Leucoraja erinaceus TaxID=7782 RepID=UPI002456E3E7|nr:HORMA domain-containing protein 1 [Leucoraja erinacea]XP_055522250.1 HORMA domain-containing protein 1 [Leucoraja erinacea]